MGRENIRNWPLDNPNWYKVSGRVHHPANIIELGHTSIGSIYRLPILPIYRTEICLPDIILNMTESATTRKELISTLTTNSFTGPLAIGQPSSAFLVNGKGTKSTQNLFIDYLSVDFYDSRYKFPPQPHDYIRARVNYRDISQPFQSGDRREYLSGHIAPLTISTSDAKYIMLFDAFTVTDINLLPHELFKVMTYLYGNKIIPLTADGYFIL